MKPALYTRNPDVVLRDERGEGALIFNPDTGDMRWLNQTGLAIWQLCDGTRDLESIRDQIAAEFEGASPDEIDRDVLEFAKDLLDNGFVGVGEARESR